MLFFRHAAIFYQIVQLFFLSKIEICYTFILFPKTIRLMCFNNFSKSDSEKNEER